MSAPTVRRPVLGRSLSVRWRLTLTYSLLFAACGLALLALVYVLVYQSQQPSWTYSVETDGPATPPDGAPHPTLPPTEQGADMGSEVQDVLGDLLRWSAIALVVMVAVSVGVGWFIAGRALAPVHAITARAQRISADALHQRISLEGRADELKEMADTFDALLDRVEDSVVSEQRLVATMSHELRTPLANQQIALEVALGNGDDPLAVRAAAEAALDQSRRANAIIEALLQLARARQTGDSAPMRPVDFTDLVGEAVGAARDGARSDLAWTVDIEERVSVSGDRVLLQRAVVNLLQNALRYNRPGGLVVVHLSRAGGDAMFRIENSGPVVDPATAADLTLPFRRGDADRVMSADSVGLGLSIVQAVVDYHRGRLTIVPRAEGGLAVTIAVPLTADPPSIETANDSRP